MNDAVKALLLALALLLATLFLRDALDWADVTFYRALKRLPDIPTAIAVSMMDTVRIGTPLCLAIYWWVLISTWRYVQLQTSFGFMTIGSAHNWIFFDKSFWSGRTLTPFYQGGWGEFGVAVIACGFISLVFFSLCHALWDRARWAPFGYLLFALLYVPAMALWTLL